MQLDPIESRHLAKMNAIARLLNKEFQGDGFCLLVFDLNAQGRMNYISNAVRSDMITAMKEFIGNFEPTGWTDTDSPEAECGFGVCPLAPVCPHCNSQDMICRGCGWHWLPPDKPTPKNSMKFRKKPVVIEAVQITASTFDADHPNPEHITGVLYDPVQRCAFIDTLEGRMRADMGDWIIRGVKGELYPCKPDVFAATHEPLEQE